MSSLSGLQCLSVLISQVRPGVNFSALVTDEVKKRYETDEARVILEMAETQDLRPEEFDDISQLAERYHGPTMVRMDNNQWIMLLNAKQLDGNQVLFFDPGHPDPSRPLQADANRFLEHVGDKIIIFRNLQEFDAQKQTGLFCLCAVAKHHNIKMDVRRIMHDYAIGESEPRESLLLEIARDHHFKVKKVKLGWNRLTTLHHVFPIMNVKKNGKYVIICGTREKGDKDEKVGGDTLPQSDQAVRAARTRTELAVIDPEVQSSGEPGMIFWDEEKYREECSSKCVFLKKVYRLFDEERTFGLSWFIPEFVRLRGIFGQIAIVVVMLTLLSLVTPLFFQIVVDKVLVNRTYQTLNVLGIGIIVAILFNGLLEYIRSYFLLFATNKIDVATATKTFRHLMRLPIDFFERIPSGVLLKHMQQTEKIRGFLSGSLFFTILDLLSLTIFVPFLLLYSSELTLVVLGYTALMALIIAALIKPFQRRLNELYQAEGKRQSMLVESIHGVRTVKSLSLEPVQESVWDDSTAYAIKSYFRVGEISMAAKAISHVLEMLMMITVIWLGARLVFDYKITIGALIAFQMLAGRVTGPLVKLVGLIHEYQQIALSVRMLGVVMNTPTEPDGGGIQNPLKGEVEFERVTFSYRPDLPPVIKNLSLKVPKGYTLGIVGRSGSGKTTITKLLQGLYPVGQGVVKIDGLDIREIDKAHLRSSIGVVLQDNYFFSGSVRENISMTKRNASFEEIVYVAKLAGADEFIQKLNRGYDTILEENASNLSGGQRQRLAIARALLPNPPILIFDEATSALDPESEYVIQKNLKQIARGRTVLIVSHRLSIVSHSDTIIVIDEGVLTAMGTHEKLLQQPGTYREFWRQQMGRGE